MFSNLTNLSLSDNSKYGTKAAALGELITDGVQVPLGFAISADVYSEFLEYNQFQFTPQDYLTYNEEIQEFILNGVFFPEMEENLKQCLDNIKNSKSEQKYVVRSSALCEDNEIHSMAGMFQSFINLDSYEDIKNAIKKCYASLFSDKVISYFMKNNLKFEELKMAVIIQQFISGKLSGVNFSVDTIDMNKDMMHINAVNGLCDDYVSGKLESAFYKINKSTGEIIENRIPENFLALSNDTVDELYKITLKIEKIFNEYEDIEWTMKDGEINILQARPITTFKTEDFPIKCLKEEDLNHTWVCEDDKPLPPLINELGLIEGECINNGAYTIGHAYSYMEYRIFNGYVYYRSKEMANQKEQEQKFLNKLDELNVESKNIFQDVVLAKILKFKNTLDGYILRKLSASEAAVFLEISLEHFKYTSSNHCPVTQGCNYVQTFMEYCQDMFEDFNVEDFYDLIFDISILNKEREFYVRMASLVKSNEILNQLFKACPYNDILYARINKISEGKELLQLVDEYKKEFGICSLEGDVLKPYPESVCMEAPSKIIGHIRGFINTDDDSFFSSIEKTIKNKNRVKSLILKKLDGEKQKQFLKKLELAEKAYLVRDNHHYYFERMTKSYLRLALVTAGKILVNNNTIQQSEDIYFLSLSEIKDGLLNNCNYTKCVYDRKEVFNEQKRMLPPQYIGKEPVENAEDHEEAHEQIDISSYNDSIVLKGLSGLRKKVRGKVHMGVADNLCEDCILVMPYTRCGNIEPIINHVKGFIVEIGSPFEHLGIIAREMNIPAVYGVKDATKLLKNGDEVEIDGITGEVIIIK